MMTTRRGMRMDRTTVVEEMMVEETRF